MKTPSLKFPQVKQPRIVINLIFFALLGAVLAVWAVRNIITIDALERPFPVTADFATSPGLHRDLEVTHLGVKVGRVGGVRLRDGHVEVRIEMDRGVHVPKDAGARVLRKSAIGEPYIELTSPKTPGGGYLAAGDRIPLARTAGTTDYKQLFTGLSNTLKAVDPRDARTLFHEAATGLQGRGTALHDMIGDTDRLTATLAANAPALDALATQLTRLTATLTEHRYQLVSGVNDLAAFTATMRQARRDLDTVLAQGPGTLGDLNDLLRTARPGLDCLLSAAAVPTVPVFDSANRARIEHVLRMVPTLQALVSDVRVKEGTGSALRVTPVITVAGPPQAAEYAAPATKPTAPALTLCPASKGKGTAKSGGSTASAAADSRAGAQARTPAPVATRPVSAEGERRSPLSRSLPLLPPALAVVVVLAVAANVARTLVRRRSGARR
ncbi:MCE family protein [Actinomadura opuntiae]|uniref:MCE family protein n=1 Tax=Actinomadura sp. OS1-43 TaxID=604315 RepID=UPI00255AA6FA|nr:MCE family protein [Actinomadura sp. OS1-43]MDL4814298.1 MCE family protein [Actinomadura sp. OS1-43]